MPGRIGYSSSPTSGQRVDVTPTTPLPVTSTAAETSEGNTTTTPLASGATFTGPFEETGSPDVMVSCQTDNSGTLFFDFSPDGTNVNTFPTDGFVVSPGIHEFHVAVKGPRQFRARLVNDSGAQSYLRLYTYYGQFKQPNAPLNQTVSLDSDASQVRPTDFQDEVRIGRRSGVTGWTKFGYRSGLTASAGEQTIWNTTGNFTPQSAAETYTITYDNTTDGEGTTGALTLAVSYIDGATGQETVSVHTLGNDGSDTTSFSAYGINRVAVSSSGTANMNTNAITFTGTSSSNVAAVVPALESVTNQSVFTMAEDRDGILKLINVDVSKPSGGNAKVLVRGYVYNRFPADTCYRIFRRQIDTSVRTDSDLDDPVGFALSPTDVIYFIADTDTNGAEVDVRFSLNTYQRQ